MAVSQKQNNLGSWSETGSGPIVVLLHGFGEDSSIFNVIADQLPGYRVLLPDLPGTGRTSEISDMSMESLADWLDRWIKTISEEKFVLIGHSMGGYIALAFAEKYREKLFGLGLYHSTAFADTEEKKNTRKKGIDFMQKQGATAFLSTAIPGLYSQETKDNHPELIEAQLEVSKNFSVSALIHYYEAMMARPDRTSVLTGFPLPVLFIFGRHDAAVPIGDGLKIAYLPSQAFVHVLEHSGHMGMREEPELSISYLLNYLREIKPGQPQS